MPNSKIEIQNPNSKITNPNSQIENPKSNQLAKRNHNPKSQTSHLTPEIRIPKSKIPKSKIQNLNSWIQNPRFRIQISSLQFKIESSISSWILTFKIETQSSRAIPQVQIILELKNWSPEFESESSSFKVESSTWKLKLGIPDQIRLINASDGLSWIAEIFFVNATPQKAELILTQYLKKYSRLHLST